MKSLIASSALILMGAGSAFAGPYAVVENNGGFVGSDFVGSIIDFHLGWEGEGWYAEFGPSLYSPDGAESDVLFTGKAGGSYPVTENLSAYGEFSVAFDKENSYGTKVGLKYTF